MLSINTNLSSIITQNNLKTSTLKLNQTVERMSTGCKINHAKDNAATYSISTNMTTKIGAYQIAEDNVAMGLDLIATANDSLSLISNHLLRIRDLAIQTSNGTYGKNSLEAINAEVNARVDEMLRLYNTTEYNGQKLLQEVKLGGFIDDIVERDTSAMTTLSSVDETTTISSGEYSISSAEELEKLATMTNNGKITGGEFVLAADIDLSAYSTGEGWTPIGNASNTFKGNFDGNGHIVSNLYINRPDENYQGLFGFIDRNVLIKNTGLKDADVSGYNEVGGLVGFGDGTTITNSYATGNVTGIGNYVDDFFFNKDSAIIDSSSRALLAGEQPPFVYNCENDSMSPLGIISSFNLQVGINGSDNAHIGITTSLDMEEVIKLRNIGLDDSDYLSEIDKLLNKISAKQTEYGAAQNRLESALEEISTHYENLTSSHSTLRDADVAKESSEYIKQQSLQQASTTLMATANQTPALALQLL